MTEEDSLKQDRAEVLSEILSEDKRGEGKEAISEECFTAESIGAYFKPDFQRV